MRAQALKRLALYGAGAMATGALAYAGFVHQPEPEASTLASCARFEMSMGLFPSAHEKAEAALCADPKNLEALLVDAHCLERLGDRAASARRYECALEACDDADVRAEILVALAMASLRESDAAGARQRLVHVPEPKHQETRVKLEYVRGLAAEAAADDAAARAAYARCCQGDPGPGLGLALDAAERWSALGEGAAAAAAAETLAANAQEKNSKLEATYVAAKLKYRAGMSDSAFEGLRSLRGAPRASLAGRLAADAEYWLTQMGLGAIPADIGSWLSSSPPGRPAPK